MAAFTPSGVQFVAKGLNQYLGNLSKANKAQQNLGNSAAGVGKKFAGLGKGMLKFGALAGGAALVGIGALTAGLVAFGASAVREGAAYSKAMSNVAAVSGATAAQFDELSESAETLGRTTKFTAVEAAEGMSFLAMAGFEVNDIIGAMPGVLNLAAAGNLDLGKSADIVSNILTGFGGTADETGRFVDVLTKTFVSSNTNLVQLGQAMKFVAPVAADLGLSVEDVAAAMGVMGDAGIQASMAGTGLRTILLRLAAPTGGAKDLIEELGINVFDAQGNMLEFSEIIGNVGQAMEGMTDAQREATLNTLVGKRAISAFSVLLAKGEDGLRAFGNELRDSGGTAAEIAAKQLDNLSGDVTLFKSALSGIKIDIFKKLEPILRDLVSQGKDLLEAFGPRLAIVFDRVGSTISRIIEFGSDLISAFQAGGISAAFSKFASVMIEAWNNTVLPALSNLAVQFWDWITLVAIPLIAEKLPPLAVALGEFLLQVWESTVLPVLQGWGETFFNWVNETVVPAIPGILSSVIEGIATFLNNQFPVVQETLASWAERFWLWVQDVVSNAGQFLAPILGAVVSWALSGETQSQLSDVGVGLGTAIANGVRLLAENQALIQEVMTSIIKGLAIAAVALAGLLIVVGSNIVAGILEGILQSLGIDLEAATFSELSGILRGIATNIGIIAAFIGQSVVEGISTGIASSISFVETAISDLVTSILDFFKSLFGIASASTVFFAFGVDIVLGLIEGIASMAGQVLDIIGGLLFGGGGEKGPSFDLSGLITSLADVLPAIQEIEIALTLIGTETLILLGEAVIIFTELFIQSLILIFEQILIVNQAIVDIYIITLPTLQAVTIATTQIMITAFLSVIPAVEALIAVVQQLVDLVNELASSAERAASALTSGFENAKEAAEDLDSALRGVLKRLERIEAVTRRAVTLMGGMAGAVRGLGVSRGLGLGGGIGLHQGLGLGFRVPDGFPNDSFGPLFVESGEEILVTPRGQTIEGVLLERLASLVGNGGTEKNFFFNMSVDTGASASAVVQQYEVMRALIGD